MADAMYKNQLLQDRLQAIFDRRGGYKARAAEVVSTFLLLAQNWGAGDALAGSMLNKMRPDQILPIWRAIVGTTDAELPCRMPTGTSAFLLLDKPTGDTEMDQILLELEYGARSGTATGFGTEHAATWAREELAKRTT